MEVSPTGQAMQPSFLAAIPASAKLNGGRPAVLALTDMDAMPDPTVDLLERMAATDAYVLNDTVTLDAVDTVHTLQAVDSSQLSAQLTSIGPVGLFGVGGWCALRECRAGHIVCHASQRAGGVHSNAPRRRAGVSADSVSPRRFGWTCPMRDSPWPIRRRCITPMMCLIG